MKRAQHFVDANNVRVNDTIRVTRIRGDLETSSAGKVARIARDRDKVIYITKDLQTIATIVLAAKTQPEIELVHRGRLPAPTLWEDEEEKHVRLGK